MERWYNEESSEEPYFEPEGEDGEGVSYLDQESLLNVMQMDLAQKQMNQDLIDQAVGIAEKSWFWSFKSAANKMKEIETIYRSLVLMIQPPILEPEEYYEEDEEGE